MSWPKKRPVLSMPIFGASVAMVYCWNRYLPSSSVTVIYFGRPTQILDYLKSSWEVVLWASFSCFITATLAVVFAGVLATLLLTFGLFSTERLFLIENFAAISQTLPVLVIATISLLLERQLFKLLSLNPSPDWYCLLPVTFSLVFPPLINGAAALARLPVPVKALLRLWKAPSFWRIQRIYLPYVMSDILTGVRASSAWAVGAVLIAEGLMNGVSGDSATLGRSLMTPFTRGQPGQTLTVLIIATLLGFFVYYLFSIFQRWLERLIYGNVSNTHASYPFQSEARHE